MPLQRFQQTGVGVTNFESSYPLPADNSRDVERVLPLPHRASIDPNAISTENSQQSGKAGDIVIAARTTNCVRDV
jgi:hypothetical protein